MSFSDFEYAGKRKQTRRERFLAEMEQVVPWSGLVALIEPHYPKADDGRKPYPLETMLRIHLLQNWFSLSDPAMEEALYEITSMRQFSRLTLSAPIPEDTTIMNFRHLLEKHQLAAGILETINAYLRDKGLSLRQGTIVDATIIHAPISTKNKEGKRDPEMHQTKKGNQYFFGIKAHIGADAESGLMHHVHGTAANVAGVTEVALLLHGAENVVCADAGYTGVEKRPERRAASDLADHGATQHLQALGQTQCALQSQAQDREGQGAGTCKSGAPVPGDQAPVRLCEDSLSWLGQEHSTTDHVVCAVEPVDGAPAVIERCGRGAPIARKNRAKPWF